MVKAPCGRSACVSLVLGAVRDLDMENVKTAEGHALMLIAIAGEAMWTERACTDGVGLYEKLSSCKNRVLSKLTRVPLSRIRHM
jgi:hypothetical protein